MSGGSRTLAEFLAVYDEHRVRDQERYYEQRIASYERSERQLGRLVQALLVIAAAAGATAAVWTEYAAWLGVTAGAAAALATAAASWSEMVGFAAHAESYRATRASLAHARPLRPDGATATADDVREYVDHVEAILSDEVTAWSERWHPAALPTPGPAAQPTTQPVSET